MHVDGCLGGGGRNPRTAPGRHGSGVPLGRGLMLPIPPSFPLQQSAFRGNMRLFYFYFALSNGFQGKGGQLDAPGRLRVDAARHCGALLYIRLLDLVQSSSIPTIRAHWRAQVMRIIAQLVTKM